MKLQRTLKLVLNSTKEQKQILLETIDQYKFAYNYTCKVGWESELWSGVELHKLTYYTVRDKTSLPSQLVISARVVATESLKSAIKRKKKDSKVNVHKVITQLSVMISALILSGWIEWKNKQVF